MDTHDSEHRSSRLDQLVQCVFAIKYLGYVPIQCFCTTSELTLFNGLNYCESKTVLNAPGMLRCACVRLFLVCMITLIYSLTAHRLVVYQTK